jgi:hypothetical protein
VKHATKAAVSALTTALLLVGSAATAQARKPVKPPPPLPTYASVVVGTSPQAAAQGTVRGRTIGDLGQDAGRFYVGYGDFDANTGPIDVTTFDPATGQFSANLITVPTEEINVYRKINGKVYAPMIDPRLAWTANVGYATNASGAWTNQFKAPAIHVFDVASLNGSDLWFVGSAGATQPQTHAVAYRSTDGGATWAVASTDRSVTPNGYERYYWAAAIGGKLYLQAEHVNEGSPLRVFNGSTWSTSPVAKPCGGTRAGNVEVFRNRIICMGSAGGITAFDGTTAVATKVTSFVHDLTVPGDGYIYALTQSGIYRSADGLTWTGLASSPAGARSIAVYNRAVYLGTTDATIVKLSGLTVLPL